MMSKRPPIVEQGLKALNQGEFYEAHEYFEDAWRDTPDESREFYRALLHISGGFYRLTQDRPTAAKKFFSRARHWLQAFPNPHLGLETDKIRTNVERLIAHIDACKPSQAILEQNSIHIPLENQEQST
jgi:uncharacterized protein